MVRSSTDALSVIEGMHADMESRTFVSFDVIAEANDALAKAVLEKLSKQKQAAMDEKQEYRKCLSHSRI
jgi:hypothetical protein